MTDSNPIMLPVSCAGQVVLVEAGGNDFSNGSAPPDWQAAYKAFLQQARAACPCCLAHACMPKTDRQVKGFDIAMPCALEADHSCLMLPICVAVLSGGLWESRVELLLLWCKTQVRSNAPDAYIVVLALPGSVGAAIRGAAANSAYIGNLTTAVKDLQDGGFQRLTFLQLPSSVVQVPLQAAPWAHALG